MKTILQDGYLITAQDKKAFEHYCVEDFDAWIMNSIKGMINKAVKNIKLKYLEEYIESQTGEVSCEDRVLITEIIKMPSFKPFKIGAPKNEFFSKKDKGSIPLIKNGINIEDYEHDALNNYYLDYTSYLIWLIENKIHHRKKAFRRDVLPNFKQKNKSFPAHIDDFIENVCNWEDYSKIKTLYKF